MKTGKATRLFPVAIVMLGLAGTMARGQQKQSIWQKIQQAAQQKSQAGQQPQQPGQQPAKNGQPASGNQVNDSGPFTPPAGTKIEPVLMAPIEQGAQFLVSPFGIHVVTLSHSGSRGVMIYDGAPGPKFDQFTPEGGGGPVGALFSPDGNHYAYCGLSSDHFSVMLDGKEVGTGNETNSGMLNCSVFFSPNSKHFYFTSTKHEGDYRQGLAYTRLVIDGKTELKIFESVPTQSMLFSPDGNHFAAIFADPTNAERSALFIDGKPAGYAGGYPQWSADSQHLYTQRTIPVPGGRPGSVQELMVDGKPIMRADSLRLYVPPVGNMTVAVVQKLGTNPGTTFLAVGGRPVPGGEVVGGQISEIAFSPDGKHYAAHYINANRRHYIFADGKKGLEYPGLNGLAANGKSLGFATYTADSSTLVYCSYDTSSGARYLVVNGEESENLYSLTDTVLAPSGNRVITEGSGLITINGKTFNLPGVNPRAVQAYALSFSPDAAHYALVVRASAGPMLFLDGVAQTAYSPVNLGPPDNISTRPYIWSPDSKHIAYLCRSTNPAANNDVDLCVDDKAVRLGSPGYYANLTFTSDSNHLLWSKNGYQGAVRIFADGKPVQDGYPISTAGFQKETWQTGPNGNLLVLLEDNSSMNRISITPSPNTSIETMMAGQ
jgi:Tol biopolymer transport system component